jgi:glycerol-3-phosphate dehydrogenase
VYYDGQMNDSQLNVVIACTAALVGAVVLNHAEAISLKKDEVTGIVTGARIHNKLTGNEFDVHVKVVINVAGPFCDEVQKMADNLHHK